MGGFSAKKRGNKSEASMGGRVGKKDKGEAQGGWEEKHW